MADEATKATGKRRGPVPGTEQARHGGDSVRKKYGVEFYSRIGKQGGETVKQKRGTAYYAEIGHKGGAATAAKHGPEFYSRIGKKGGERGRGVPRSH
jgi:general stress protein YciG